MGKRATFYIIALDVLLNIGVIALMIHGSISPGMMLLEAFYVLYNPIAVCVILRTNIRRGRTLCLRDCGKYFLVVWAGPLLGLLISWVIETNRFATNPQSSSFMIILLCGSLRFVAGTFFFSAFYSLGLEKTSKVSSFQVLLSLLT